MPRVSRIFLQLGTTLLLPKCRGGCQREEVFVSPHNSMLKASEALQLNLSSTVNLYLALGGGWDANTDEQRRVVEPAEE